jgi:hypothetical protein
MSQARWFGLVVFGDATPVLVRVAVGRRHLSFDRFRQVRPEMFDTGLTSARPEAVVRSRKLQARTLSALPNWGLTTNQATSTRRRRWRLPGGLLNRNELTHSPTKDPG